MFEEYSSVQLDNKNQQASLSELKSNRKTLELKDNQNKSEKFRNRNIGIKLHSLKKKDPVNLV